jgi:hypothetical protein
MTIRRIGGNVIKAYRIRLRVYTLAAAVAFTAWLAPANQPAPGADTQNADRESARPAVLRVGSGRPLARPSDAARVARDGDIVEIEAGTYDGDTAVWRQSGLTIRGVGGRAHLRANGAHAEEKGIWVIKGSNTTIESIEFSGASVRHRNGAGIRLEGPGLIVRDCYFHDNENGILTGANAKSDILIERSEFARNGFGDGYSHNLYIGTVRSFTLRYSYVHRAVVGHNVKSRALRNEITYNRIMDENDGRSSYAIDLPNGGLSYVIGNAIQQGPATENDAVVAYGAEGLKNPITELYFASNTVVNDLPAGGRFVYIAGNASVVLIVNNVFSGPGEVLSGSGDLLNNVLATRSDLVDAANFDYRLRAGATAIGRGVDSDRANGVDLRPTAEYAHKAKTRMRSTGGTFDLGAFEYRREH